MIFDIFWQFSIKRVTDFGNILREDVNGQDFIDILMRPSFLEYTSSLLRLGSIFLSMLK